MKAWKLILFIILVLCLMDFSIQKMLETKGMAWFIMSVIIFSCGVFGVIKIVLQTTDDNI